MTHILLCEWYVILPKGTAGRISDKGQFARELQQMV